MSTLELRPKPRLIGLLYLINIAGCAFDELTARSRLIVWNDPAATLANVVANPQVLRLGTTAELVSVICFVVAGLLFYRMLKPVNRDLALLSIMFVCVEAAVHGTSLLVQYAPLVVLKVGGSAATVMMFFRLHDVAFSFCWVFFGLYFTTLGWLILRSTFLPKAIGALTLLAGACCLVNGFVRFLGVPVPSEVWIYLIVPFGLARVVLGLWLLLRGINFAKWEAQAA